MGKSAVTRLLILLGGVLAALGLLAAHFNRQLFDGPTFAERVDEIRRDPAVAELVGREISRQIVTAQPDLAALRPLVDDLAVRAAGGSLLSGATRQAARTAHTALVEGNNDIVVLRITDAGAVVTAVLAAVAPDRAPVTREVSVTLAEIGGHTFSTSLVDLARAVDVLAWALPAAALACFAAAIALAEDRWRAAASAGRALVGAALAVGVGLVIGGFAVRRVDDDYLTGALVRAAWWSMVRPLWTSVAVVGIVGVATVLGCDSSTPAALAARVARARTVVTGRPRTTWGLVLRLVVAAAVGIAAIVDPLGLIEPLIALGGVGLVLFAVVELSRLAEAARRDRGPEPVARAGAGRPVRYGLAGVAAAVLVAAIVWQARPGGDVVVADVDRDGPLACNGHVELCDRPYDDVAYAASHNAMAVLNEPGWFLAEQTDPIPSQLDQGVRVLLIDVWSGQATRSSGAGRSVVRTSASSHEEALRIATEELGPEVVEAALRVADSIAGDAVGPERRYMCHGLCETGSTPFVESLVAVRGWLVANPDEVVTLFIEDHVPAELIAEDVAAAGLLPLVATPPAPGEPWPTLGEMVETGRRLVVMVEAGAGGEDAPWLVNGFEHTQETPYTFPTVGDLNCDPSRGPDDAPLFLLNHWLSGFSRIVSNAELVNQRSVLLARAEQCREERGQLPNFIAVNYVDRGDLYAVVDELNGLPG